MTDTQTLSDGRETDKPRTKRRVFLKGLGAAATLAAVPTSASAQSESTYTDTFEDGQADGWENINTGTSIKIKTRSYEETYSAYGDSVMADTSNPAFEWVGGPTLDLTEEFIVTATTRYSVGDQSKEARNVRFGITGEDQGAEGENALLLFDYGSGETYLGTEVLADSYEPIQDDFYDTWVKFKMKSKADSDTIKAKVWPAAEGEPNQFQLETAGFEGQTGKFGFNPGNLDAADRKIWLDSVQIEGTESFSEYLEINTKAWLDYGQTTDFTVTYQDPDTGKRSNVTDSVTVTSSKPNLVSVDNTANTITATSDANLKGKVQLTATYTEADDPAYAPVTVAAVDIENIDILPLSKRFQATFTNDTFAWLLASVLTGVGFTRLASSFAGLGAAVLFFTLGWIVGWIGPGMAMVGVFTALFIGLNLAANIDYSVRRE